jgi:hypothetical protein
MRTRTFPGAGRLTAVVATFAAAMGATAVRAQPADPFEPGASVIEVTGAVQQEAWNKNLATETLFGGSVLRGATWTRHVQATLEFTTLRIVQQRARDSLFLGMTFGARVRVARIHGYSPFAELSVGVSGASAQTPRRGSYFNYVAQAGFGVSRPVSRRTHVLAGVRWVHLSNAGLFGNDRNPDIEAFGGYVGLSWMLTMIGS